MVGRVPQGMQELYTAVHGGLLQRHKVFQVFCSASNLALMVFLRVVPDFIVQGGDPTNTGTGGINVFLNDSKCLESSICSGKHQGRVFGGNRSRMNSTRGSGWFAG